MTCNQLERVARLLDACEALGLDPGLVHYLRGQVQQAEAVRLAILIKRPELGDLAIYQEGPTCDNALD